VPHEVTLPHSVLTTQIEPLATMTPKDQSLALLRSAGRSLGAGEFTTALELLEHARALDPFSPTLADLTAMAEGQRAVAETRAQRRAEFREHLDVAAALLSQHDLPAASARLAEALRLKPGDPEALVLQGEIARQLEKARPAAAAAVRPGPVAVPARAAEAGVSVDPPPPPREHVRGSRQDPANDESDLKES